MNPLRLVVLISGRGSNLTALIDAANPLVQMSAVISNQTEAKGLLTAQAAGIPTAVLDHRPFSSRLAFDQALQVLIDRYQPEVVALAGFMRILTPELVAHYRGRLINIHPSLLPKFKGLHTHQRVLAAGLTEHGASVHFVTAELDGGPVILQAKVPVLPQDDEDSLAARVLMAEHKIYPQVIHWFAQGRIRLEENQVFLDDQLIQSPVVLNSE